MYRVATAPTLVVAEMMNMMIIWYRAACMKTLRVVHIIVEQCKCFYRTDENLHVPHVILKILSAFPNLSLAMNKILSS